MYCLAEKWCIVSSSSPCISGKHTGQDGFVLLILPLILRWKEIKEGKEGTSLMLGNKKKRERLNVETQLANSLCSARLRSVRLVLGSCWKTNEPLSYLCHFLPSPLCYRRCVNLQKIRKIDVTISRLLVRSSEANKSRP